MAADFEWALVADAQRARIFRRLLPAGVWSELVDQAWEVPNPSSHDQGSERPGRVHQSVGSARHAIEPRSDPHRAAKLTFATYLGGYLEGEAPVYASLVLVAPPAFLGDLRLVLGKAASKRLRGALDKDLTHATPSDIAAHLDLMERS